MNKQAGFTLIELVLVIVILGILAATAIPRFSDLSTDARRAALQGMEAGIRSAAALARATQLAQGLGSSTSVTMEGTSVAMANGYPTAAAGGIDNALTNFSGFTFAGGVFTKTGAPGVCNATYTNTGGASPQYNVVLNSAGC